MKTYACPKCNKAMLKKNNMRKNKTFRCYYCSYVTNRPIVRAKIEGNRGQIRIIPDRGGVMKRNTLLSSLDKASADPYKLNQTDIRNHALIAFLYLTACRISEVVGIKDKFDKNKYSVEPLRKSQISKLIIYGSKIWRVEGLPVLKRKLKIGKDLDGNTITSYALRNVSVLIDQEEEFIAYIEKWLKLLPEDDSIVFNLTRNHSWRICLNFENSYNNYWRHCRLTNLATDYGFTDLQLQHFIGWSNSQMAEKYTHLDDFALVQAMINGIK